MQKSTKDINIAYIGGGSMNFGWKFIGEICQEESLSGVVRLYDIDKKLSLANEVVGNNAKNLPDCKTQMIFLAVDTLEEALRKADFVVLSITVGEYEEYASDISMPEMYGVYQAAGDNTGPGGVMRAIRTVPEYIKLAKKIKDLCPDAWVISLTDPMSVCIKTLYKTFPEIKAFGSTNDTFSVQQLIADIVTEKYDEPSVSMRDIKTNVIGINKFCWINDIMYKGDNLFDLYAEYAHKYADTGFELKKTDYRAYPFMSAHRVQFDMFLRYGMIAASLDMYLAESCGPWYLSSIKSALNWKFGTMSVNYMKKRKADRISKCRKYISGEDNIRIGWSGTDCIAVIKAILGEGNLITNVVTINQGQISNLPVGSVVETNALFSQNSVKPVMAGSVPDDIKVLMQRQISNSDILVDALLAKDLDSVFNVFINDPLMTLDIQKSTELYKQMLATNKSHMVYYVED